MLRDEFLKFLRQKDIRCNYVFCTGDIRVWNKPFPDEAADYLKSLCDAVSCDISRLFIVPGNHDVNRSSEGRDEAIAHVMFQRNGYYEPAKGVIEDEELRKIYNGQADFRAFLGKIFDTERMSYYEEPLAPHFSIETPDFNILHVDSTLSYRGGQEVNDLVIGTKLLQNALKSTNPSKPTILLTHYSFTSLLQDEKKYVSELLYGSGVCLWLAGHEHDHNLQPVKYLYSVQAGELRYEDKAHATVLIGNFDTNTYHGYISAYTWFPEGWAEYPIVWHNDAISNGDAGDDKFTFELRLSGNNGKSRERVLIDEANKEYVSCLPDKILNSIFPDFEVDGERYSNDLLSLMHESWTTDAPHLILLADGGMGKSTMLLQACQTAQRALYISVGKLQTIKYSIVEYCASVLFEGDGSQFRRFTSSKHTTPDLILLIDGLNEVGAEQEQTFIDEVKSLNMLKGIQIVISSRSDFTPRYSMFGYKMVRLLLLRDEQINSVFEANKWSIIKTHPTLHHLLSNPMMLTMYLQISPVIEKYSKTEFLNWRLPIENATDLLFDYYTAQIAVLLGHEGVKGEAVIKAMRCVYDILPFIAYSYERGYSFNVANAEFREKVKIAATKGTFDKGAMEIASEYFRCTVPDIIDKEAIDLLTNVLHLIYKGDKFTAFPHQIHRDYLSAYWIVRETERIDDAESLRAMWNSRKISYPVMSYIRQLSGKYWSGIAEKIHKVGKNCDNTFNLTSNLLECFPYTDKSGIPDYSELDLRGLPLSDFQLIYNEISLKGTKIDEKSIGKIDAKPLQYQNLVFSDDNGYLASSEGTFICIFPLRTNEDIYRCNIDTMPKHLEFVGNYLFAVIKNEKIIVFKHSDKWTYMCEIKASDGGILFSGNFHKLVLKDDILYFYFNNRERQYQLSDGKMICNHLKKRAYVKCVDGYDLTHINNKQKNIRNKTIGQACKSEHNGLTAIAMEDGSLIVSGGSEIYNYLNKGISLLKDGAISGDGKWVATLSYAIFNGKRKIQLWNLDKKEKIKEIYCLQEIEKVHLSQYGTWIIGETDRKSWVCNIENGNAEWFEEHLISNQKSKLITYGDWVFRKNNDNLVYLYNLKTKESKNIENLSRNSRIAVLMPDDSLATVGNNANFVLFKNTRSEAVARVNSQPTAVLGIFPLKKKPFIAIATQDNVISIYHTGTEQRLRIINSSAGNYMVSVHPEEGVIACSNGQRFGTHNFYEWQCEGQNRGRWYSNSYKGNHNVNGTVLDLDFNAANHELVVILSNGEILFCHEKYCDYHSKLDIITNFNVAAYDFRGCICSNEIREQLKQNGALI